MISAESDFDRLLDHRGYAREILAAVPGTAVVAFDLDLRVRAAEGNELDRLGLGRAVVVGKLLYDVLPATAWAELKGPFEGALAGHDSVFDFHGEGVDYSIHVSPLQAGGGVVGGLVVSHAVTEQRRLQAMVDAQGVAVREARRAAVDAQRWFEMSNDMLATSTLDGFFTRLNSSWTRCLGYSHLELMSQPYLDLVHPDDRQSTLDVAHALADSPSEVVNFDNRYQTKDGGWRWLQWNARSDGECIYAQAKDITKRKEAEMALRTSEHALRESDERWRTLLAHIQEIVIVVDSDRVVTYASPSVKRWLGYDVEELLGGPLSRISPVEDAPGFESAIDRCASLMSVSLTHRLRAKSGDWRSLESTVVSLHDDPLLGAVLIASRDVTEGVELAHERERLELDRRVSQRLEAVGQLAAGIAHEINTPLQFVGDSVKFLRQAVDELLSLSTLYRETLHADAPQPLEQRRVNMRQAEESADVEYLTERIPVAFARTAEGISRVRSIVEAMKRFSHAGSGDAGPADINEAIRTTLVVCRNEYKYVADVTVELEELPYVVCNIGELNQVFLNLIINAAQAIEEQVAGTDAQGTISLSTRLAGSEVVIEIGDDGPGIPPELRDRIYEPFFTTKAVGRGTGQGLALARATIDRHSGSLECVTAVGKGTTFTIRLPLEGQAAEAASAA